MLVHVTVSVNVCASASVSESASTCLSVCEYAYAYRDAACVPAYKRVTFVHLHVRILGFYHSLFNNGCMRACVCILTRVVDCQDEMLFSQTSACC